MLVAPNPDIANVHPADKEESSVAPLSSLARDIVSHAGQISEFESLKQVHVQAEIGPAWLQRVAHLL